MPTSRKLRFAHFLMIIGVVPVLLATGSTMLMLLDAKGTSGQASGGVFIVGSALMGCGYAATLLVAGSGLLWSCHLTGRRIDEPTTATRVLRWLVGFLLVAPLIILKSLF